TNNDPQLGGAGVTEVDDADGGTGTFAEGVTGLSQGTRYSFVAFATNSAGTAYTSPVSTFTALAAPTVTSPTAPTVNSTAATLGGDATSDGGASITKRGILYAPTAANNDPQLNGAGVTEVDDAGGTGTFAESVAGLSPGTGYSFVAFATNSVGTTYTSP